MANQLGRYVWLVSLLRNHGRLSYEEIARKWEESGLRVDQPLTLRTFHNHRKAIADVFEVDIECDTHDGYRYYIENEEQLAGDTLRSWLIDSYTVLNQIQADRRLEGRIIFEEVPSGSTWLTMMTNAIRTSRTLSITYQGFGKTEANTFDIEPYYLKVVKRRWYVIARAPYYSERNRRRNREDGGFRPEDVFRVYALDRTLDCQETDRVFAPCEDFDINEFFDGCLGIIASKRDKIERVVGRAYGRGADYLRSLPLHRSQRELSSDQESATFEWHVRPNFEFYQAVLAQADQLEILEPHSVRQTLKHFVEVLIDYYG